LHDLRAELVVAADAVTLDAVAADKHRVDVQILQIRFGGVDRHGTLHGTEPHVVVVLGQSLGHFSPSLTDTNQDDFHIRTLGTVGIERWVRPRIQVQ
jgi:hypothetical protein